MTMKKNLRLSVFLLALVVLLSVLSVTALAGEKAPFEVIKLTGEDSNGTAGETLFYVIPDKKVLVSYYAAGAPNVYPYKATWTALNADGQEVSDVTIKCDDLKVLAGQESIFEITYNGKTETYKQYYMQEGYLCSAVAYSVYADNDTPHITRKNSGRLDRNGCMSITVDNDVTPPQPTIARNSPLTLEDFYGEIISATPADAVTIAPSKRTATVDWYKTSGKIVLTVDNFPAGSKITEQKTITIYDKRPLNDVKTVTYANGSITPVDASAKAGAKMAWTAYPEDGYKLDKSSVSVKDAFGSEIKYTWDSRDPNKFKFDAPYGEVKVSAKFIPLEEGDESSVSKLISITLGGHKGVISGTTVKIEGFTADDDLTQLAPVIKLSKGSTIKEGKPEDIRFESGKAKTITVLAEDYTTKNKHSKAYKVTVYKMELEGEGTEENPFLINTEGDFKKFVKMHPYAYYKQTRDLNLSGFTAQTGGAIVNVQGDPFKGIYDGGGYKITGLQLKNSESSYPPADSVHRQR